MSFSKTFIDRPIATSSIMAALLLAGALAFMQLPISALPTVDFPTINVNANLPGASPETMASSVAAPLERRFAQIPSLTQMTSSSGIGNTQVTLQFELDRNLDGAAQDVQSAINAAAGQLPKNLPNPPRWFKANPADPPILILGVYSEVLPPDQVDDFADTIVAQQISQVSGVGQVNILGERKRAVRVQIDPALAANQGISLEDVRTVLGQTNVNAPKGGFQGEHQSSTIETNDQLMSAEDYGRVVVAYRKGAPVHIDDIGDAVDGIQNTQTMGWVDTHDGFGIAVNRIPGANVIETADRVKAMLPRLQASLPPTVKLQMLNDKTQVIRASVLSIEETLMIAIVLVVMMIFLFLRKIWATVIPGIAVPLSLVGTFGGMYLLGYSIDNLSLMALTIAVGFVVDDAIVMIENVVRYIEQGETPYQAAIKGSAEVGFTIVTMTFSLIAVFIPLLLMGGIVGRLFHEFAVTVSIAVLFSGFISLTLTPMLCARFLGHESEKHGRFYMVLERFFERTVNAYAKGLRVVLRHQRLTLASVIVTIALSGALFALIPKGFFPQQDTGVVLINSEAAQDVSFDEMVRKQKQVNDIVMADPATFHTGPGINGNSSRMPVALLPFAQRTATADEVIRRLRPKLAKIPGYDVHLQSQQDVNVGARFARTQYQYTLQGQDIDELTLWSTRMFDKMKTIPQLTDVATDLQNSATRTKVNVDRETASRLGIQLQQIDDTLYDAFGQRQVGQMFTQLNQYYVILEVDPKYLLGPSSLSKIYVKSISGAMVPLSAFTTIETATAPLSINHQGQFPAVTLSFNLSPNVALGDAVDAIQGAQRDMRMPAGIAATFQGNAQAFQASLTTMPYLIAAALVAVYLVLSILYESYIHPLTILSTIPSAGVGALLMLWVFNYPLDMLGLIGIILLIGLVKKNAIMMIDFALDGERRQGLSPEDAIYHAALLRFRPIMMTTMSAILAGIPLMLGHGAGYEFRRPLGYAIVGGLLLSQALTLFTTPVVYLYLDRLSRWMRGMRKGQDMRKVDGKAPLAVPAPAAE